MITLYEINNAEGERYLIDHDINRDMDNSSGYVIREYDVELPVDSKFSIGTYSISKQKSIFDADGWSVFMVRGAGCYVDHDDIIVRQWIDHIEHTEKLIIIAVREM